VDPPGGHNMLVFGERTVFLSHFPMFQQMAQDRTRFDTIHRFQVIMEASFETSQGQDVTDRYRQARQQRPEVRMYSLQPEQFVLQRLFAPPGGGSPLTAFRGLVFFNHLERSGAALVPGLGSEQDPIVVRVRRVVHAREFRPEDTSPEELEYILFGKGDELFLAHLIATPADFDQVLPVVVADQRPSDEELNRGLRVRLDGRPNTASDRLREEDRRVTARVRAASEPPGSDRERGIVIEPRREIYFEESELRTLPIFGQTSLEREAGF